MHPDELDVCKGNFAPEHGPHRCAWRSSEQGFVTNRTVLHVVDGNRPVVAEHYLTSDINAQLWSCELVDADLCDRSDNAAERISTEESCICNETWRACVFSGDKRDRETMFHLHKEHVIISPRLVNSEAFAVGLCALL